MERVVKGLCENLEADKGDVGVSTTRVDREESEGGRERGKGKGKAGAAGMARKGRKGRGGRGQHQAMQSSSRHGTQKATRWWWWWW